MRKQGSGANHKVASRNDKGLSREVKVDRVLLNESTKVTNKLEEGRVIQYRPQPFICHDRS